MKPDIVCPRCSAVIPRIVVDAGQPCPTCVRRAGMVKNWDPKARVNRRHDFEAFTTAALRLDLHRHGPFPALPRTAR